MKINKIVFLLLISPFLLGCSFIDDIVYFFSTDDGYYCFEFEEYDPVTDECYVECDTDEECAEYDRMYAEIGLDENDCFEFEEYDPVTDECYVECNSDEECEKVDLLYDDFFQEQYDNFKDVDFKDFRQDGYDDILGDDGEIARYRISNEKLELVDKIENPENLNFPDYVASEFQHNTLWNLFNGMFSSTDDMKYLVEFSVFSDGKDNVLAFVSQTEEDLEKWYLAVDFLDSSDENGDVLKEKELIYTLIHEFGHLMTLNADQLNIYSDMNSCDAYFPGEGCSNDESYINLFFQKFWQGVVYDEFVDEGLDYFNTDGVYEFYQNNSDQFVTDYAATNPAEDIAESWTYYVLQKKPEGSERISDQKILFFYDFPELVSKRKDIRSGIAEQKVRLNKMRELRARIRN